MERLATDQLHSWIGYVPQEQILFSKTVRQNIQFGKKDASDELIMEAITTAAFDRDLVTLSDGLDTIVGEKAWRCPAGKNSGYPWLGLSSATLKS